ncbi:MAG: hypothetical protein PHI34_09405 [Acidobacteriota bacterium]|nr:hypothetical protein [Acidobacteriota bacterium]
MTRKTLSCAFIGLLAVSSVWGAAGGQDRIEKPPIFRETYPLVSESDFYCSFFVLKEIPAVRIEAADSADGMTLIGENALVWARGAAVRPGQVFVVVERNAPAPGSKRVGPGPIAFRQGRLRVIRTEGERFLARIEKACGAIQAGAFLLPFEDKAPILGKDAGYDTLFRAGEVPTGRLVFFRDEVMQAGAGDWVLIDIGSDKGLRVGQQLTVYGKPEGKLPARAVANAVIVDAGPAWATVKVLSARDVLHLGDLIQVK